MFLNILIILLNLLGFEQQNKPKHDLHKKNDGFRLTDVEIMLIIAIVGVVIFGLIFVFMGHCVESGLYYNDVLY